MGVPLLMTRVILSIRSTRDVDVAMGKPCAVITAIRPGTVSTIRRKLCSLAPVARASGSRARGSSDSVT
ncbi:MAG TPA: hypothetical protein VE505_01170 [Vicinamibacterales bacterium]|nr:hypothetical protein [Vicinamibacterales bacterium]